MIRTTAKLIDWYRAHARDLPWRRTLDPYKIWVSEIILQQTRVDQGLAYYLRFTERFRDIHSLASAEPDEVMKAWQGLGYYSRARNMQAAAKQIMEHFDGIFPQTHAGILSLKGIGPYTAAAIASICFGEPVPVVDGNVIRFIGRLHGIREPLDTGAGRQKIHALASGLMDPRHPGTFNQAMMEFGALYCKPSHPDCPACIFRKECIAHQSGLVGCIPARGKTATISHRHFHYFLIRFKTGNKLFSYLRRREANDIWKGLYEFPLIETAKATPAETLAQSPEWKAMFGGTGVHLIRQSATVKHQLTHQTIHAKFFEVEIKKPLPGDYLKISGEKISEYPLPRLIERYSLSLPLQP